MPSENDRPGASRLIARYQVLMRAQADPVQFHRKLEAYLVEWAKARGQDELFVLVDARRHNPHWGRPLAIQVVRKNRQTWLPTMKINVRSRAEFNAPKNPLSTEKGLMDWSDFWNNPLQAQIIQSALRFDGDHGWWRDPQTVAGLAFAVLTFPQTPQEADADIRVGPPEQHWPTLASRFPGWARERRATFARSVLEQAQQMTEEFERDLVPERIPWDVFRNRGPLSIEQALARYLTTPGNGLGLPAKQAADAMGIRRPSDIQKILLAGKRRLERGRRRRLPTSAQKTSGEQGRDDTSTQPREGTKEA